MWTKKNIGLSHSRLPSLSHLLPEVLSSNCTTRCEQTRHCLPHAWNHYSSPQGPPYTVCCHVLRRNYGAWWYFYRKIVCGENVLRMNEATRNIRISQPFPCNVCLPCIWLWIVHGRTENSSFVVDGPQSCRHVTPIVRIQTKHTSTFNEVCQLSMQAPNLYTLW
jgi:hypothetical protein